MNDDRAVVSAASSRGRSRLHPVRLPVSLARVFAVVAAVSSASFVFYTIPALQPVPYYRRPPIQVFSYKMGVTSALISTYRLLNREIHVGDTVHFVIQAKDSKGRYKNTGGDFWFPVLTSATGAYPTKGGRTAGRVVDHDNGTYSVFFYAGWEGAAYVHMTLAAPSEATKWLRTNYWPIEKRVFWNAGFSGRYDPRINTSSVHTTLNGKVKTETTVCYLLRNVTSTELCVIDHNPKAMGLTDFFCEKPQTLECSDFKTVVIRADMINTRTNQLIGNDTNLFETVNFQADVKHGPLSISISKAQRTVKDTRATACKPDDEPVVNNGFWLNDEWHHLQCKVRRWDDVQAVRMCLRHKHVFIHGDSNVRIWYGILTKKLGRPWKHLGTGKYKMVMHDLFEDDDLEMSFYFHPRVVTSTNITLQTTPYEVDVLDNIQSDSCGKYIIVLCPWGHFTQWTTVSFMERTQLLKEAVLRFRERCPDVPIIIKGSHPREHETLLKRVYASDYTLWDLGIILRDAFRGTGVFYYDVWQMNLAYGKQNIHMPLAVINEEVNWLLSYVCK